jgi:hypothetical protein
MLYYKDNMSDTYCYINLNTGEKKDIDISNYNFNINYNYIDNQPKQFKSCEDFEYQELYKYLSEI